MQDRCNSPDIFEPSSSTSEKEKSTEDSQNDNIEWRGVDMNEIYRGKGPWSYYSPPITPSRNHTVLYEVPITQGCIPKPHFTSNACHWNNDHVRMPFSHKNLYPVKEGDEDTLKQRWELIQLALLRPIANSIELQDSIFSYNSKHSNYDAMHYFFNEVLMEEEHNHFFEEVLPKIVQLALQLPELIPSPIPLLKQGKNHSISLSQLQISSLLANGFFCTFPWRRDMHSYPGLNFNDLYESCSRRSEDICSVSEKLKCIIHYFRRVTEMPPTGVVTFERRFVSRTDLPRWDRLENKVADSKLHVTNAGTIEDSGKGLLQVDFANCYVGGGVLGRGCVQEEIRFVTWPELLVSRLFTQQLAASECLLVIGPECFSKYEGYADTFRWAGNRNDDTPRDSSARRRTTVVAIDALYYMKPSVQFSPSKMIRELNKAYVGYKVNHNELSLDAPEINKLHFPAVATGNWGCGAFRGNVRLKALLQIMACSAAGRDIVYYTFGDARLRDLLYSIHSFFQRYSVTISQLWRYLCRFNEAQLPARQLFPFIQQSHLDTVDTKKTLTPINSFFTRKSETNQIKEEPNLKEQPNLKEEPNISNENDNLSPNIIESSQPEYEKKEYISELFIKKNKLKRNDDQLKKNHDEIKSFLYSSDEDESLPSSSGLIQAADNFFKSNINETEKMECDNIEEVQIEEEIKVKINTKVSEKSTKKISDYFKVVPK